MRTFRQIAVPVSLGILSLFIFNSCSVGIPDGASAVKNFEAKKYLGKWYEIARFDFRFEKNLNNRDFKIVFQLVLIFYVLELYILFSSDEQKCGAILSHFDLFPHFSTSFLCSSWACKYECI